jgi:hypothetical protein
LVVEQLHQFDFFSLTFDENGKLTSAPAWKAFTDRVASHKPTDAIFIAHGFRNDEGDARSLYSEFLRTFRANMARPSVANALTTRRFIVAGIFWPSKTFRESFGDAGGTQSSDEEAAQLEEAKRQLAEMRELAPPAKKARIDKALELLPCLADDPAAQDAFAEHVLSIVDEREADPSEGLDKIRSTPGSVLFDKLSAPIILPIEKRGTDDGGAMSLDTGVAGEAGSAQGITGVFGSVFGRVGQFLNLTTWYVMKNRSGVVGATGVAQCVRELRRDHSAVRIHLVGHSLGGRLMASCGKSLAQPPAVRVDSLTLLQAAFSHFGLSADNRDGQPGFFRDVIDKQVVKGPMVATFSFQDTVVGKAYAIASRLAGDNTKAVGDRDDPYGGIGRNGAQNLNEHAEERLHDAGSPYMLKPRIVHCLDGSGGLITSHGDVENERVTWAFASAVAATT